MEAPSPVHGLQRRGRRLPQTHVLSVGEPGLAPGPAIRLVVGPSRSAHHPSQRAWVEGALTSGCGSGAGMSPADRLARMVRSPASCAPAAEPLCSLAALLRSLCPGQLLLPVHDCEAVRLEQRLLVRRVAQPLPLADEIVEDRVDPPGGRACRSGRRHCAARQNIAAAALAYAAIAPPAASRIHHRPVDGRASSLTCMSPSSRRTPAQVVPQRRLFRYWSSGWFFLLRRQNKADRIPSCR
jgi:hypothetical protein